jgi:hypothetical protein
MKKQIYIAGPMTGIKHYNFEAFDAARDRLLADGWQVASPADMDRSVGFDPILVPTLKPDKEFLEHAMRRDIEAIQKSHAIYMLDGWEQSTGARAELGLAQWRHIEIFYQTVKIADPVKIAPIQSAPPSDVMESILDEAIRITSGSRRRDYDSATPNHERIAGAWNWYLKARKTSNADVSALDVSAMMILLKLARACHTPTRDSFVDVAGYARCCAQIAGFETE